MARPRAAKIYASTIDKHGTAKSTGSMQSSTTNNNAEFNGTSMPTSVSAVGSGYGSVSQTNRNQLSPSLSSHGPGAAAMIHKQKGGVKALPPGVPVGTTFLDGIHEQGAYSWEPGRASLEQDRHRQQEREISGGGRRQ
ncbi:hypothetical protein PABG_01171 [Paracoccidioides brasiliensis Pb03]|nr:hypothetical protein PABG_01171 [Paracoccidioides brasiliensis Pb03]